VPAFIVKLRQRDLCASRLALEAVILTAARSGEIRGAMWSELNEDFTLWTVPAERMKAGVTHVVPLSQQAAEVFKAAKVLRQRDCDLIFPGAVSGSQLSDMALLQMVRGLDHPVTVHGFRSSFRDWVAEETDVPREIAEAALAHTLENKVEAAYRRTDFLAKRRALMDQWANYCLPPKTGARQQASRRRSAAGRDASARSQQAMRKRVAAR